MISPGTLRHSKTHRAAILKQWSKQYVQYELIVPGRWLKGLRADDVRQLIALPAGGVVRAQALVEFGNEYRVLIDIPRSASLAVSAEVAIKCRGRVAPPRPGEIAQFSGLTRKGLSPKHLSEWRV